MPSVNDILLHKGSSVATVSGKATVHIAASQMNQHHIGALVVLDDGKVVGIFTERDILNRVVAPNRDPASTQVAEVMTSPVAFCHEATTLAECQRVMSQKRIRHLPVMEEGELRGIISTGDILAGQVASQQTTIEYLNEYLYGPT
jgi:CBS domain-containing protein